MRLAPQAVAAGRAFAQAHVTVHSSAAVARHTHLLPSVQRERSGGRKVGSGSLNYGPKAVAIVETNSITVSPPSTQQTGSGSHLEIHPSPGAVP